MKNRPAGEGYIQRDAGLHKDGGKDGMVVAIMSVLVVIRIIRVARRVVIRMSAFMMVMIMRMKARGGHILPHVTMQASRRCPGELERNDEHDDQGDEAAHGAHSTEMTVSTKSSFIPWTPYEDTRFARCTGACRADGCKRCCYPLRNGLTVIKV